MTRATNSGTRTAVNAAPYNNGAMPHAEFETFLRRYPRSLEARPLLTRKANYREWVDPELGAWPGNAVAKCTPGW